MDFIQSMGYSRVLKNTLNTLNTLNNIANPSNNSGEDVSSTSSVKSAPGKLGCALLGSVVNNITQKEETSKIKNNLGLPILIKILSENVDYSVLKNNKSIKIKKSGEYKFKYVVPKVDDEVHFEKGTKISLTININTSKNYELNDYIAGLDAEQISFYNEQLKKMKLLENQSHRSRSLSSGSTN